jgi:FKBP-type peptidyl-prolyl cis-trans isomerase
MIPKEEFKKYKIPLEKANRGLLKIDRERIEAYLKRRNWQMQETGTGLRYMIYEKGEGEKIEAGDVVELNYEISLLDGSLCYSSDSLGVKSFKVGQGGVESGLEEGILLLSVGDKARFIILPFMAHSLLGDFDKIPPRSIIVYEVEVLQKLKF